MQRQFRLRRASDFAHVRATGRSFHHAWFSLRYSENGLDRNRYAIVVARRVGGAVQRNRARRLLREAFRLLQKRMRTGYDLLVTARPAIVGQSFHRIQAAVEIICSKAGLIVDQRDESHLA